MFKTVNIDSIRVGGGRIRRELGDLTSLSKSITLLGWVSPIVVDENLNLVAGYRRLEALRKSGVKHVEVQVVPSYVAEIVQAVENTHRKGLRWDEMVEAVARVHIALTQEAGKIFVANNRRRKGWTQEDTASLFGISQEHVSKCLRLYRSPLWEKLREMRTFDEAYEELLTLEGAAAEAEKRRSRVEREIDEVEKRVDGELFEKLKHVQRKLTVVEILARAQQLEKEVGGLCPLHERAKLNLWDVKLSCGHSLGEVADLLHKAAERMERRVGGGE